MSDVPSADEGLKARALAEQAVRAVAEQAADMAAERTASLVADKIVERIFLHLGIDSRDPDQLEKLREDLSFLRRMNRGAKEVKSAAIKTCVGAFIAGLITVIGYGLREQLFSIFHK